MSQHLIYGKISWSYDEEVTPSELCLPIPLFRFNPFIVRGKKIELKFSDKICFKLLSARTAQRLSIQELYREWLKTNSESRHLGEGRSLLEWMKKNQLSVEWKKSDLSFHPYFNETSDCSDPGDELSNEHAFSIPPVVASGRRVKLYVKDEDVLRLLHLPGKEVVNFLELVRSYVIFRFEREPWQGPALSFVDWVAFSGLKPLFLKGQLSWDRSRYFAQACDCKPSKT